ncbi:MAG: N-acetyltransferase family protein [Pseudohongiellaceae bacterium]
MSPSSSFLIRNSSLDDISRIFELYLCVAKVPGGLARHEHEITVDYVDSFVRKSLEHGVSLVAEENGIVCGEIHAYTTAPRCFSHVLSELTVAILPQSQGKGLGRNLFESLINRVLQSKPEIKRIELIARESNTRAISLYSSLGFNSEGRLRNRIRNADGSFDNDIPMAWLRE